MREAKNGQDKSSQPCAIITPMRGSLAIALRRSLTGVSRGRPRSHARATSYDRALYRASLFQPTSRVTISTIALVVGAISASRIGSFDSWRGDQGMGSNAVTLE